MESNNNYVTVREFQMNAGKYLEKLPIILTRYGSPVARVVAVSYEIKDVSTQDSNTVNMTLDNPSRFDEEERRKENVPYVGEEGRKRDWVDPSPIICSYCKKEARYHVRFENPETFEEESQNVCEEHLKTLKKSVEEAKIYPI